MLENINIQNNQTAFRNPEEEIAYLRAQIREKEIHLENHATFQNREDTAREVVHEYSKKEVAEVLHSAHPYHAMDTGIKLPLSPERDDGQISELLGIMMDRGVKKALQILNSLESPHLADDFHRFLVQYLVAGLDGDDLKRDKEFFKQLNMVLYEVVLPGAESDQGFKQQAALMEQLYASLVSIADGKNNSAGNYFVLEIGLAEGANQVVFYVGIPRMFTGIFQKQVASVYPKARLLEKQDDYNIFNENGAALAAFAMPSKTPALPIKLYSEFEQNPVNVILNTFDKLKRDGEGAALQIVVMPKGSLYTEKYGDVLDELRRGKKLKDISSSSIDLIDVSKTAFSFFSGGRKTSVEDKKEISYIDEDATRLVGEKISSTIFDTNIRLVVSAETTERAKMIKREIESAFNQFAEPKGNSILFTEVLYRKSLDFFRDFSYRTFNQEQSYPLNIKELASLYHFPSGVSDLAQLKQSDSAEAPAPMSIADHGTQLGVNEYRNIKTPIYMAKDDRVRHFYVVGQTGTGKTTILKNMIIQDIKAGHGCCFIDPHGSDIDDILANIPPERIDDVIYFDPSNIERPMGLNMLEYDTRFPEQKSNVVDELFGIFNKLFDMKTAGGPAFEQYFRNAAFTVMAHPESGNTLMEIGRVMSDKKFRDAKLEHVTNPLIRQFWVNAEKTTGEAGLSNFVPYITNKFDVFLSNDYMRPIVTQEKSAFNFRDIMDGKKIFLANLAKGRLGDINSSLLGLIIVGKITMAALSRVDASEDKRPDFYLYIDEFQNFTTPSIATILSEARKYRLSLNIAHQYIKQLTDEIKNAVFGNVGSMAVFRVEVEDAEYLEKQFNPVFTAHDIIKLPNRQAYIKMLVDGNPQKPFNISTLAPTKGDPAMAVALKNLSALKYGTARREVEAAMLEKFNAIK